MPTKRTLIRAYTYAAALLSVMAVLLYGSTKSAEQYRLYADNVYYGAFSALSESAGTVAEELDRLAVAASPAMISSTCARISVSAGAAQSAISYIPDNGEALSRTAAFYARAADHAAYIADKAAKGAELNADDLAAIENIRKYAKLMDAELNAASSHLRSGEISLVSEITDERASDISLPGVYRRLEALMETFPELNYDGKYSDHLNSLTAKLTEGMDEVTGEEAIRSAANLTGLDAALFTPSEMAGRMPLYVLTATNGTNTVTVEVCREGGFVKSFFSDRSVDFSRYSADEAIKKAENYLAFSNLNDLKYVRHEVYDNKCSVFFCHCEGGVKCYPDEIRVTVALDTLEIVAFDAGEYIAYHTERTIAEPTVSRSDAESGLHPSLSVLDRSLAIIMSAGGEERLCHEFSCGCEDGSRRTVYINGDTGLEERIDTEKSENQ